MKKLIVILFLVCAVCIAQNGYFRANTDGTIDVVASSIEYTSTNVYNDLRFPASRINLAGVANPPDLDVVYNVIPTLNFDNSGNEHVFLAAQMDHHYRNGSALIPHLHIISEGTVVTGIWQLVTTKAAIGDVFGATYVTNTITNATSGVDGTHELWNMGSVDGFSSGVSGMLGMELKRLSGGTATELQMCEIDIHYVEDGPKEYP